MKSLLLAATAALVLCAGLPATAADVIYQNGPLPGLGAASEISTTVTADSFIATTGSVANTIDFNTWVYYQDAPPTSVDWAISNGDPFNGGTVFAHGTAATTSTYVQYVFFGIYNFYNTEISIGSVTLTGDNYWLSLTNGTKGQQPLYWALNGGPSSSFQLEPGAPSEVYSPSHAFAILGTAAAVSPVGTGVPEPAAWTLMLAGFGGVGVVLRRRRAVNPSGVLAAAR